MSDYRELLIGCGRARDKRIHVPGQTWRDWRGLVTLDINPHCGADLWCDLNSHPPWDARLNREFSESEKTAFHQKYPNIHAPTASALFDLESDYWDEIHAYEVLEHLGQQGDAHAFLTQFSELYRLLKPDGFLCATVPSRYSPWLWGDPSHRRVICQESLVFLDQDQYIKQIDRPRDPQTGQYRQATPMSDFRDTLKYRADFKLIDCHDDRTTFRFILQAMKPSRYRDPAVCDKEFAPGQRCVSQSGHEGECDDIPY